MVSSGIRDTDSTDKRTKKLILDREEDLINSYKTWDETSSLSSLAGGGEQSSGEGSAPGNFMPRSGDNWLGQYGYQFEIVTIQNGQLNASRQSGNSSPMLVVNPEGGFDDFLDTIIPGNNVLFYQIQKIHTVVKPITIRPKITFSINSIVGIGGNIVEVTISDTTKLNNDDKVDIGGTSNFNFIDAIITVTSGTTFTYDLGTTASTTPENVGDVDRGNITTKTGDDFVCPVDTLVNFIFNTITRVFSVDYATIPTGGSGGISFPIDFPEDDRGTVGVSTQNILFSASTRHSVKIKISGDVVLAFSSPPTNETAYSNIVIVQDNTGNHTLTLPAGTVNKDIVEAGFLTDPNLETGIVIKFAFGVFYAFLETGNIVSGGGGGLIGYDTIQDEGSSLIQQNTINFIGTGVVAVNNPGQNRTDVTITSGVDTLDGLTDVSVGGAASGQSLIFNGSLWTAANVLLSNITINADKSWNAKNISDILSLGSNAANLPGSGFIRMGTAEEIRMRNPANADDLIITSGNDLLGNQAILFDVAGGKQLSISEFDIDVVSNDIINTRDIIPAAGAHEVGTIDDFYNQMHSQFFVPLAATIITNRHGLAKTGNTLYVNYDDTNTDAGFGIYEEGIQQFLFSNPVSNIELLIGTTSSPSGETTRIVLGTGSANGVISFTNAIGNDLLINRGSPSPDQGVQINDGVRFLSDRIELLKPLDVDTQDLINVVDVKSDGGGGATTGSIGELITANGGFDYFMRNKLTWESNSNTYLQFTNTETTLASNTGFIDILKIDATPNDFDTISEINFKLFDSLTTDTYGSIVVTALEIPNNASMTFFVRANDGLISGMNLQGDDNNQRFELLIGGITGSRIQPQSGQMGYFVTPQVTDFSLNIGTSGTLEFPRIEDASPSVNDLNSAAGAVNSVVIYSPQEGRLYVRDTATSWDFWTKDGTLT